MYKTIVVPVDVSHSERAKEMIDAAQLIGGKDANLILTYVIADVPTYVAAELPSGMIDKTKQKVTSDLEKLAAAAGIKATVEVRAGQAAPGIRAVAEEHKADLIVVASHRPGLQDYLLGSTAARVVRHAKCSVLVLR